MGNASFIVGDAGGTGTQWRVVKEGEIRQFETVGFNAYTHDLRAFKEAIRAQLGDEMGSDVPKYIYAAGIETDQQKRDIVASLKEIFKGSIHIENDLIGVARALCGKDKGNVSILGTGANACYYDGEEVNRVSASLGYVLGDEGSGAHLGKLLLKKVFRGLLAGELIEAFQQEFSLSKHEVIEKMYHQPMPNHFLASFATFIHRHQGHPDMYTLIIESFDDFFDAFWPDTPPSVPFYFAGSIAHYFSDMLREAGQQRGFLIARIVQSPIAGLVLFHQQYG